MARLAAPIEVLEFSDVNLRIHLPCAPGERFEKGTRCEVDLVDERDPVLATDRHAAVEIDGEHAPVLVPIDERGDGALRVRVRARVRIDAEARTRMREFCYLVPVTVGGAGSLEAEVRAAGS